MGLTYALVLVECCLCHAKQTISLESFIAVAAINLEFTLHKSHTVWAQAVLQCTVNEVPHAQGGGAAGPGPCMQHPPAPPPPRVLKDRSVGAMASTMPNFLVPCLVERGTMPLVLKTLKTFFLAMTRYHYYRIHTSIPPCPRHPLEVCM